MINPLLSRAKTDELNSTSTIVTDVVKKSSYKDEKLTEFNSKLANNTAELTIAQNRKKKNDETDIVEHNEDARDDSFQAFKFECISLKYRDDEALKEKARYIYEIIERHGTTLYSLPDNQQTAKMKSLFEELKLAKSVEVMEGTELPALFEVMQNKNQTYLDSVASRSKNEAEREDVKLVTEWKKKTKVALENLIGYLNVISSIDQSEALVNLCTEVKSHIDKANSVIRSRNNRKDNSDEQE
jgi:23S rRNA maturation mini-RNase III